MARGFGASGSGATDRIASSYTGSPVVASYWLRFLRNGSGGGQLGRFFDKSNGGTTITGIFQTDLDNTVQFVRAFSVASGSWGTADPIVNGVWNHILVTMDASSDANDALMYIGGTPVSLSNDGPPSGTATTTADPWSIGNRADGIRNWNGLLAEFAVFDRILDATDRTALFAATSPMKLAGGLPVYCAPLCGLASPEVEVVGGTGAGATVTGALTATHPPVDTSCFALSRSHRGHRPAPFRPGLAR